MAKTPPLLCELHAHTTWSDGACSVRELCDLPAGGTSTADAVAVGLRDFVGVADGLETALVSARAQGAALVAAHPYSPDGLDAASRPTAAFAVRTEELAPLVDRFELFNRHTLFDWVAEAGLPAVASGDFHRLEHLRTWKTLLPCQRDGQAVVASLRSRRPAFLVPLHEAGAEPVAA